MLLEATSPASASLKSQFFDLRIDPKRVYHIFPLSKNCNFLDCDWLKKLLLFTNSPSKLLSDSLLLNSLLSDSLISQSHSKL